METMSNSLAILQLLKPAVYSVGKTSEASISSCEGYLSIEGSRCRPVLFTAVGSGLYLERCDQSIVFDFHNGHGVHFDGSVIDGFIVTYYTALASFTFGRRIMQKTEIFIFFLYFYVRTMGALAFIIMWQEQ